ncbi:Starch-binding domain-containing protein 1 [Labeo rohita]|uniref:Starch-binding domain-containing protein 1 n=1 Tax=Labeo rohita TaxID=84645 RepID=A0ABQ8LLQ7_LABRO|nr:uncharacterized protein stbd1 [Labeo rohita]KAI2651594.1 Starch-binding domain-containing protein 1 [Labeo rohita]
MTMKKSKPIALDRRDIHSLLDVIGGFGAVVAVGIIAMLSVCAAFFIYRSFRGQRGKGDENNGNETTVVTEEGSTARRRKKERDDDRPNESTGDEKQEKCSESTNLSSTDSMLLPTEVPEKDLNESTLKDLEEITDELLTDLEPEMGDKTDSDLDQCVEMDPDENTECEEHIQQDDDDGECEVLDDVSVGLTQLGNSVNKETEEYLDKSVSLEADEPSETESAREIIYQRHQDHITTQSNSSLDQAPSNPSKIQLEEHIKTSTVEDVENTSKKFEDHHDWRFPRTNNFDCCCCDKKTDSMEKMKGQPWFQSGSYTTDAVNLSPAVETMVNHSGRFDFQNYLGFQIDNTFMGGSSPQVSLSQEKKKTDEEDAEKKLEKNEISIMDAIMDNNEWLNVGAPEFKDLPWLTPTATEEKQTQQGQAKTGLANDEEEPANKRVATVPPLSQTVNVTFRIHYITYSSSQLVAVTGSLQELGNWERFVPLQKAKDGFWANTVSLPVESQVEWKFILVEDGRISRWEECGNRFLFLTSQDEDVYLDKCWGCC